MDIAIISSFQNFPPQPHEHLVLFLIDLTDPNQDSQEDYLHGSISNVDIDALLNSLAQTLKQAQKTLEKPDEKALTSDKLSVWSILDMIEKLDMIV